MSEPAALADTIMRAWMAQVIRRQAGEIGGVRAHVWALSGLSSSCCGAPLLTSRRGFEICHKCRQRCESRSWLVARTEGGSGDGFETMRLHETRVVARDAEQARAVREADRYVHLAKLVEGAPQGMRHLDWRRRLFGWGSWLQLGKVRAMEQIAEAGPPLGGFSDRALYTFRDEAREIVARRANHAPDKLRVVLGGDRAA